jgi:hypothetical protein
MSSFIKLGPAGGPDGGPFDDGQNRDQRNISSIQVFSGETIDRIVVGYVIGTTSALPVQHGESGGGGPNPVFNIDVNGGERLIKVEGFVGIFDTTAEVMGVKFFTNRGRESVLSGRRTQAPFVFGVPNGEIFAFFGRKGLFVDALGVHVRFP